MSKENTIISLLKEINKNIDNVGGGGNTLKVKVSSFSVTDACINDDGIWEGGQMIDTSECTSFSSLFYQKKIKQVDVSNWNTKKITTLYRLFDSTLIEFVDVSKWDVSNVNNMAFVFNNCTQLTHIDVSKWDVKNVNNLNGTFHRCIQLIELDVSQWDTSNVTNFSSTFYNCGAKYLDLTKWNAAKAREILSFVSLAESLVGHRTIEDILNNDIKVLTNLSISIDLHYATKLERTSLRALINGLADLTGQTTQILTLGETLIAKLTEEDIAIATAKNWTIA